MTLGLVITTYEEHRKPGYLEKALEIALDPRVGEIIVSDDCSLDQEATVNRISIFKSSNPHVEHKIKFFANESNLGVFGNKLLGIRRSSADWVQSLDSDNCLSSTYIDRLSEITTVPNRMLCPSFARPEFDYRSQAGSEIRLQNFRSMLSWRQFGCMLNTGNQCFHRETFLKVFEGVPHERYDRWRPSYFSDQLTDDIEHRKIYDSADSFCFNKYWLLSGKSLYVAGGLEYDHPVHDASSWRAAPPLKEVLPPIYFQEIIDASAGIKPRRYVFEGCVSGKLGKAVSLAYRDVYGKKNQVFVDINTGQPTSLVPPRPSPLRRGAFRKRRGGIDE